MDRRTPLRAVTFDYWDTLYVGATIPERVQLRSTALREAAYDAQTLALTITFRNGRVQTYSGVPDNVYAGLIQAGSHGRYFNQWIKDRY